MGIFNILDMGPFFEISMTSGTGLTSGTDLTSGTNLKINWTKIKRKCCKKAEA
jgi:hypothetical protein